MPIVASIHSFKLTDKEFGEVHYMYSDGEVFIPVRTILNIFGESAATPLQDHSKELCYSWEDDGILLAPASVVFEASEAYHPKDPDKFMVANNFTKWVEMKSMLAEYEWDHSEDIEEACPEAESEVEACLEESSTEVVEEPRSTTEKAPTKPGEDSDIDEDENLEDYDVAFNNLRKVQHEAYWKAQKFLLKNCCRYADICAGNPYKTETPLQEALYKERERVLKLQEQVAYEKYKKADLIDPANMLSVHNIINKLVDYFVDSCDFRKAAEEYILGIAVDAHCPCVILSDNKCYAMYFDKEVIDVFLDLCMRDKTVLADFRIEKPKQKMKRIPKKDTLAQFSTRK